MIRLLYEHLLRATVGILYINIFWRNLNVNTISYSFYRRLLALILSACLVVTIIPVTKVEAKVQSIPDNTLITFRVVDNQTIRVNENGKQEAIIINDDCVTVKNVNTGETIVSFKTDFSDEAIKYIQKN